MMPARSLRQKLAAAFFTVHCLVSVLYADAAQPASPSAEPSPDLGTIADKPLYRDPVYDGAADPVVIWNRAEKKWFMFYTNRRAKLATSNSKELKWFHGTRIGIAESADGARWKYRGVANIQYGPDNYTHWAPEVIEHEGIYHMYLTVVPGIFDDWKHPREIVHLSSVNLLDWKHESTLKLASDRVIDACVFRLPDGTWRMWYNNERDRKSIYFAESKNLFDWEDRGKAAGVGDRPGEGPKVFRWKDAYWMLVDVWKGQGVYRSDDLATWAPQKENLLGQPGTGPDDGEFGRHADVVVSGDRAFVFYFTHPGIHNPESKINPLERARSSLHVVELHHKDGILSCDRNAPQHVKLTP